MIAGNTGENPDNIFGHLVVRISVISSVPPETLCYCPLFHRIGPTVCQLRPANRKKKSSFRIFGISLVCLASIQLFYPFIHRSNICSQYFLGGLVNIFLFPFRVIHSQWAEEERVSGKHLGAILIHFKDGVLSEKVVMDLQGRTFFF